MSERSFPVIIDRRLRHATPVAIPWSLVEPWRAQIERNHYQTLERLAERGGMSPLELWLAAHRRPIRDVWKKPAVMSESAALAWLLEASGRARYAPADGRGVLMLCGGGGPP